MTRTQLLHAANKHLDDLSYKRVTEWATARPRRQIGGEHVIAFSLLRRQRKNVEEFAVAWVNYARETLIVTEPPVVVTTHQLEKS